MLRKGSLGGVHLSRPGAVGRGEHIYKVLGQGKSFASF